MRTVKEISDLTGISVRTLHYYDEIGLLKPTDKSEAGYRLYDDKALETLRQILFFREFDISLKDIKTVMDSPALDRDKILQMQRKMLISKKERIERLLASIDDILKGGNKMDFEVFNKSELEELCQASIDHMTDLMQECIIKEFGGIEQWKQHYIERASKEDMQKGYQKVIEWYGGKESYLKAVTNPPSPEAAKECERQVEELLEKLIAKRDYPPDSLCVKELIREYALLLKEFTHVKDAEGVMLSTASSYRDERFRSSLDQRYGKGASEFFAQAIEAYYKEH